VTSETELRHNVKQFRHVQQKQQWAQNRPLWYSKE